MTTSTAVDMGSIPAFALDCFPGRHSSDRFPGRHSSDRFPGRHSSDRFPGLVIPVTSKWTLQWLSCQAPGVIGSFIGLIVQPTQ